MLQRSLFSLFLILSLAALSQGCSDDDSGESSAESATESGDESGTETSEPTEGESVDTDTSLPESDVEDTADPEEEGDSTGEGEEDPDVDPCSLCIGGEFCIDGECVECVGDENCSFPAWCYDNECVETECVGGALQCDDEQPQQCAEDGSQWVDLDPCERDQTCAFGICEDIVCDPGESYCSMLEKWQCDPQGTGFVPVKCPPGSACFSGQEECSSIKPNMLLVFDTSGSMGSAGPFDTVPCVCGFGNCPQLPYPACEDTACPRSRLGLAKNVLLELFDSDEFAGINFAMTRFPQRVQNNPDPSCNDLISIGNYTATTTNYMSGDGGWHIAPENGYFDANLSEILAVPFPVDGEFDAKAAATAWCDSNEVFETYGDTCTKNADCYPNVCAIANGSETGNCAAHTNPELRAAGSTPLGKSLFYAGEYLRNYVVVDGKACQSDADCANVNYACGEDGTCFDPLKSCRPNIIVLFTDGEETENVEPTDFFNPRVQAKRLHYGLGCLFDSDCSNGAECVDAVCQGYDMPANGFFELLAYKDGDGANRVFDHRGNPISARVHVVDMSGGAATENKLVADHGGGIFYPVDTGDPSLLLEAFESALDVKQNLQECIPEFPRP